jgi:hypothetical protein
MISFSDLEPLIRLSVLLASLLYSLVPEIRMMHRLKGVLPGDLNRVFCEKR